MFTHSRGILSYGQEYKRDLFILYITLLCLSGKQSQSVSTGKDVSKCVSQINHKLELVLVYGMSACERRFEARKSFTDIIMVISQVHFLKYAR